VTAHLHEALRPWATSAAVSRELRAMHAAAVEATPAAPLVFVVLLAGAIPPESIPADRWRTVEGRRVAVVPLATARDLAEGRDPPDVARDLPHPPPPRGCWCLALDATGGAHLWSTPLVFTSSAPSNARGGDA